MYRLLAFFLFVVSSSSAEDLPGWALGKGFGCVWGSDDDIPGFSGVHRNRLVFHSFALCVSANLGTQIDGLDHITTGEDNHWYNGFQESEDSTDFGIVKASADGIPPVIGKSVFIDVAGWKGVDALPSSFPTGADEMQAALETQKMDETAGDIVFLRMGTLGYWGDTGIDIGEFHPMEALAAAKVCRFVHGAMTNALRGTVAGTAMRPIAVE